MSPPNVKRGPAGDGAPHDRPGRTTTRKTTRRWTDIAPNEPPVDHEDPAYVAALDAAVDAGELEAVDGHG